MNVTDCPLSIVGFDGLIDGVPNAEFTVICAVVADAVTGVGEVPVSVTVAVNLHDKVVPEGV